MKDLESWSAEARPPSQARAWDRRSRVGARQHPLEPRLHLRPLVVEDAEAHRVPQGAALADHVLAERAFLLRSEAQDGGSRTLVQRVGLELDPDASQLLERVPQHEVLGLGVDRRSLPGAADPGPADLDAAVGLIRVAEPGAPHGAPGGVLDGGEGERTPLFLVP